MAGAKEGTSGRKDTPAAAASAAPADAGPLSAEERKTRLNKAVFELTREFRAKVQSRDEFQAVLVRGLPVNHRFHLTVVAVMAALALALWLGLGGGLVGLLKIMLLPGAYALFWLFLASTGGEQLDRVSVDENGILHSVKTGRDQEARGDFARVAIPIALIAVSGWVTLGLIHDLTFPPPPNCNQPVADQPQNCLSIPNLALLAAATLNLSSTSNGPTAAPTAEPSPTAFTLVTPGPSDGTAVGPASPMLDSADTQLFERIVRGLQLIISLIVLLASSWFVRRMLTGRWVLVVRPVHHRLSDE